MKIFLKSPAFIIITAIIIIIGGIFYLSSRPGQYDNFALCLKDKGVIFYGAFWCPHCQDQKSAFGRSARLLPYTECSTPDGKGQKIVCEQAKITSYPTWSFPNGEKIEKVFTLQELADKTGCSIN